MTGWFVTGTDTEIGKTCVSAGLAHALSQRGWQSRLIGPTAQPHGAGILHPQPIAGLPFPDRIQCKSQRQSCANAFSGRCKDLSMQGLVFNIGFPPKYCFFIKI